MSAPADRDASQLYYSYLIISVGGRGGWGRLGVVRGDVLSRSYAVSAPADRDASLLYYSCLIISVGGKGGASGGCMDGGVALLGVWWWDGGRGGGWGFRFGMQ